MPTAQEIPDGEAILSSFTLHFWNKFCNWPLSGLDIRDFIIEFIIKTILSERLSVCKSLMTLIQVKNAQLENNVQKESFERNLQFSFNSAGLNCHEIKTIELVKSKVRKNDL